MSNISLRGINNEVKQLLKNEAARTGVSINALILNYIYKGVGIDPTHHVKHHDLDRLSGTWTDADKEEFYIATREFDKIDQEIWK